MALPAQFAKLPTPAKIVISNVAGTRMRVVDDPHARSLAGRAGAVLAGAAGRCSAASPTATAIPAQLGSDRWAALIGARHMLGARAAMVVVCGTATTIDFLSADGVFKGGMIMPGLGLMLRSLHEGTAALPDQDGDFFAVSDADRRRDRQRLPARAGRARSSACTRSESRSTPDVVCLLSGGAAGAVAPRLSIPFQLHENLVLEGLYRVSQDLPAS